MRRRLPLLLPLLCLALPATAATVYKCIAPGGGVSFQDHPCAPGQRQQTVRLDDDAGPAPAPAGSAPPPPADEAPPPATPARAPAAPLPAMYTCVRATDGKSYLSGSGDPPSYWVPLGMLGAFQQPLSQVYGPDHGAAGISAPEANRGRITASLVANNYVQVRDRCRPLDRAETCGALRDAYDDNERKLQRAFDSQKPPLEARERELLGQLRGC